LFLKTYLQLNEVMITMGKVTIVPRRLSKTKTSINILRPRIIEDFRFLVSMYKIAIFDIIDIVNKIR
jgi:hypothetical protein